MIKREFTLALLCLLLISVFGSTAGAKTEIIFRQSDTPQETVGLRKAIDEYNLRNPDVKVVFETVPWADARDQLIREAAAGTGPDVSQLAFVWTMDLAKAGALLTLDDLLSKYPLEAEVDDFLGLELGLLEDDLYGIPWTVDTHTMVYRDDILSNYGLETIPDTWIDFQDQVIKIAREREAPGFGFPAGGASGGGIWFLVNYYIWSNGFSFVEKDLETGEWKLGIDEDNLAEALSYFKNFFDEGASPRSLIGISSWADPTILRGFESGYFPIVFWPPATLKSVLQTNPDLSAKSGLVPRGDVKRISHLGGRALGISKYTEHTQEAWNLLSFLTSKEVFENYYTEQFPARVSLLRELNFPEELQGYSEQLQYAQTFYQYTISPAPVGAMWDATNRESSAAFSGQKTIEQAATDLLSSISEFLQQ